jgi:adenine-specific DNA-methyltransferase
MANENNNSINSENPLIQVQTTDWNKERLEQLKQLMPDLFTNDGELNINELKKVVDPKSVNETERYEFRWFGKSNAKREAFTPTDATLVYDEARSVNPNESENLIIEGENLAVLKLLSNSYREQVKCIYIDPPYNTGNDFVYSDKFNQDKKEYWEDAEITENGYKIDTNAETDGRFHSNWLNMMYSRLLIARQLLKEDGVIFISIGPDELSNLITLGNEVFGEDNQISIIGRLAKSGGNKGRFFSPNIEYIICYAKNIETTTEFRDEMDAELIRKVYTKTEIKGERKGEKYRAMGLYQSSLDPMRGCVNQRYFIEAPDGSLIIPNGDIFPPIIKQGEKVAPKSGKDGVWRWTYSKYLEEFKKGNVEFNETNNEVLVDSNGNFSKWNVNTKIWLKERQEEGQLPNDFISKYENRHSARELTELDIPFDYAKPSTLIKFLVRIVGTKENDIILDFFAGSGTTGQAVTELNQEDGGNRKYIIVQLPEQTDEKSEAYKAGYKIISDITIERNKRVIEKIIKEKKEATPDLFNTSTGSAQEKESEQEQLKGLGFKVFKLQKSNFPRVEFAPDPEKTATANIELLKKYIKDKEAQLVNAFNREELITEILLKNSFKLNYTLTKQEEFKKNEMLFVTDGDKETLICLDVIIADETVEHFKTNTDQKLIVLERALDTTKKWNLKHAMGDKFNAF